MTLTYALLGLAYILAVASGYAAWRLTLGRGRPVPPVDKDVLEEAAYRQWCRMERLALQDSGPTVGESAPEGTCGRGEAKAAPAPAAERYQGTAHRWPGPVLPEEGDGAVICRACGDPIRSDGPHYCPATGIGRARVTLSEVLDGPPVGAANEAMRQMRANYLRAKEAGEARRRAEQDRALSGLARHEAADWTGWRPSYDGEDVDPGRPWRQEGGA